MKRFRSISKIALLMYVLYMIHFWLFPNMFPNYFRVSNEATLLFFASFAIIIFVGVSIGSDKIIDWIFGNLLYLVCLVLYNAGGAYGTNFGLGGKLKSVLIMMMFYMLGFLIFELIVIKVVQFFKK